LNRNADVVQSFDKQFGAPSATSTKTKFANRGWFGKMEASSANNLLKQEIGRRPGGALSVFRQRHNLISVLLLTHVLKPNVRSGVKLRRTQCEQMFSGLPLKADIAQCSRHVSNVPIGDKRNEKRPPTEAASCLFLA
jgi:hypothetical protein